VKSSTDKTNLLGPIPSRLDSPDPRVRTRAGVSSAGGSTSLNLNHRLSHRPSLATSTTQPLCQIQHDDPHPDQSGFLVAHQVVHRFVVSNLLRNVPPPTGAWHSWVSFPENDNWANNRACDHTHPLIRIGRVDTLRTRTHIPVYVYALRFPIPSFGNPFGVDLVLPHFGTP
jgi:hypothetical protein